MAGQSRDRAGGRRARAGAPPSGAAGAGRGRGVGMRQGAPPAGDPAGVCHERRPDARRAMRGHVGTPAARRRSSPPSSSAAGTAADTQPRAASSASSGLATSGSPHRRSSGWGTARAWTRRWTGLWGVVAGGRVTTTIFPGARPADVWDYGVDSLPFVLRALRAAPAGERLVARHADLLGAEVRRFADEVVDPARASSARTAASPPTATPSPPAATRTPARWSPSSSASSSRRAGSAAVRAGAADRLVDVFWRGDRFGEGPRGTPGHDLPTGDGNVVPFWLGVVPDDLGVGAMLDAARGGRPRRPFPLRYSAAPARRRGPGPAPLRARLPGHGDLDVARGDGDGGRPAGRPAAGSAGSAATSR